MIYILGHREWAVEGTKGWYFEERLPLFKQSENNQRGADAFHDDKGPLQVYDLREPFAISQDFVDASVISGLPHNRNFNGTGQAGIGLYQVTQFHDKAHTGEP